jgi:serine-type D-Ala-D-Ala carboxypeptidase/endopeptidase (penicillin-binding protein 4)
MADFRISVGDPARFAAMALRESLIRHGVEVKGEAVARHVYPGEIRPPALDGAPVATHESAALIEDLRVTDKVSQNLHAELLLRTVARQTEGHGSLAGGLDALRGFLTGLGIAPEEFSLRDGSGLSRMDLLTPDALVTLLQAMRKSPQAEAWRSLLPVSGVDGSLRERLDQKAEGKVLAKTGSLTHVAALSGYARTRKGREVTFSILVNDYNGPQDELRLLIDQMLRAMVE